MRLLHVSDTHIGFTAYSKVTPDGLNQREADFFDSFKNVIDLAIAERVDVVLHSGDLFDSVRPTNRAIGFVLGELVRLHDARVPFVVISGNHEAPRLRETGAVLRLLDFIPGVHAVYKGHYQKVRVGDLTIHAVPHAPSNEDLLVEVRKVAPDAGSAWNVAALHVGVMGVGDFRTGEFNEQVLPQNELPQAMDYVALGHYHRASEIAPRVWYAGSTERSTFRECAETKSVNLVDLRSGRVEVRALPTRAMLDLPALACEGMAEAVIPGGVYERLLARPLDGAIVRLRVTGLPAHIYSTLDFERIKRATASALHFDLQADLVRNSDAGGHAASALGELGDEFGAFLGERALQGADRDALLATAKELLSAATSGGG